LNLFALALVQNWYMQRRSLVPLSIADQYGSPSLEDVTTFSRLFNAAFEEAVGEAAAGDVEFEVSSPVRGCGRVHPSAEVTYVYCPC
jgi:ribosome maturation factor RimP